MQKTEFPILRETVYGKRLVYLDNAATTQKPQVVLDAIQHAYTHFNANIHRGVHHLSQVATQKHEEARQKVASFIGAASADEVIFTKGTTDSINMLARSLSDSGMIEAGDEIIVSTVEHHSNIVPWQLLCNRTGARLRVIPLDTRHTLDIEAYKALLNEKTKLVAICHVSNVLGIRNQIEEIIRLAHESGSKFKAQGSRLIVQGSKDRGQGIPVMIDAAQSASHLPIDVQALDCDFMAFSAHKMYGPTGLGVLYGKREWLDKLPPAEGGGEMIEHVSFEKTTFNTLPYKFEAGTPNFIGSYAFGTAIDYMQAVGMDNIRKHERELCDYAESKLSEIPEVEIYATGEEKYGVISFNVKDCHPYDVGMLLDKQGIAVRTGHHCAEPLIDYLHVPGTVRASFAIYNTKDDVDAFLKALQVAIAMLR